MSVTLEPVVNAENLFSTRRGSRPVYGPVLEQFVASGEAVSRVVVPEDREAANVANCCRQALRRMDPPLPIDVRVQDGKVYLVRTDRTSPTSVELEVEVSPAHPRPDTLR